MVTLTGLYLSRAHRRRKFTRLTVPTTFTTHKWI